MGLRLPILAAKRTGLRMLGGGVESRSNSAITLTCWDYFSFDWEIHVQVITFDDGWRELDDDGSLWVGQPHGTGPDPMKSILIRSGHGLTIRWKASHWGWLGRFSLSIQCVNGNEDEMRKRRINIEMEAVTICFIRTSVSQLFCTHHRSLICCSSINIIIVDDNSTTFNSLSRILRLSNKATL